MITDRSKAILLFLAAKRKTTLAEIASELCCSRNTIASDILTLTVEYPIETKKGNGGGVRLAEGYTPLKRGFTPGDVDNLKELFLVASPEQVKTLHKVLQDIV